MTLFASGAASPATLSRESELSYSFSRAEDADPCHAHPDFFTPSRKRDHPRTPPDPISFDDPPRALVRHDTRGAVKLVADSVAGKVLGVHALADGAGETMLAATYAIKAGMTVKDLAASWAPYLTMSESLRIAAGLFRNQMPTSYCA